MGDLACFLSQTCSTLYSNWTLPAELKKLVAYAPCRCPTATHAIKKRNKKTPWHFISFVLSFLLYLYDNIMLLHKVQRDWKKGIEGNSLQKVFKVQWQVTYLESEKKLDCTLYLETGKKTDHSLNLFLFFTFSKSFTSLFIADWNLFLMHSLYLKQALYVHCLPFYKKASVLTAV